MNYLQHIVVAQCVQVSIVTLVAWLLADTLFRHRPRLQYTVWSVVLLKCIIPPLLPSLIWPDALSGPVTWLSGENLAPILAQTEASFVTTVQIDVAGSDAVLPRHVLAPTAYTWTSFTNIAAAVWMVGVVMIAVLVSIQLRRIHRRLRRRWPRKIAHLESAFEHVQQQFSRQAQRTPKVRLVVTRGCFGPAAMQVFDPLIAIPGKLAQRLSSQQLRPVLAHEIMHVGRGDLWLGWLQTVAVCLCWFHPLVWLASRRLSIAIEQCCDEDAMRLLQCEPADYRHGLLATLLWKNSVPALPVASAIRPAQLTRYRMEALMKIDPLRPAPLWRSRLLWLLMVVLLLPGARLSVSAPPAESLAQPTQTAPVAENNIANLATGTESQSETETTAEDMRVFPKTYRVRDLVLSDKIVANPPSEAEQNKATLANYTLLMKELTEKVAPESWESAGGTGTMTPYPQNVSLVVSTRLSVHDEIEEFLTTKRQELKRLSTLSAVPVIDLSNVAPIELQTVIMQGPYSELKKISDAWQSGGDDNSDASLRIKEELNVSESKQTLRVHWAIVDPATVAAFTESQSGGSPAKVVSRPVLMLMPLALGSVTVGNKQAIVARAENGDLVDEQLWTGIRLDLTASTIPSANGGPSTPIAMRFSSHQKVPVELENAMEADSRLRGYPILDVWESTFNADLLSDKTLLVLHSRTDDDPESSLVAFHRGE